MSDIIIKDNFFEPDLREFLESLEYYSVRYMLVGGISVLIHGYIRTTVDMDVWVERSKENYEKLCLSFARFGMPMFDMTLDRFLNHDDLDVFTFGRPPLCIDLMNRVKGLTFEESYKTAQKVQSGKNIFRVISLADLRKAKKAANRHKDLDDLEHLPLVD